MADSTLLEPHAHQISGQADQPANDLQWRRFGYLAIAIAAIIGFAMVIKATRNGAGITLDSTRYLIAANDLRAALTGDSLHRLVHYPPLFPLALSIGRLFGARPIDWARWFDAALMSLNVALAGIVLLRIADRRSVLWIAIFGLALLISSTDTISAYSSIWSEPLYMTFLLLGILYLHTYLTVNQSAPLKELHDSGLAADGAVAQKTTLDYTVTRGVYGDSSNRGHPLRPLILAAIAIMLACMTRYAGASLIGAGVIAIVWLNRTPKRWLDAGMFLGIASSLPLLWGIYNRFTVGTTTNRNIGFHPPTLDFHIQSLVFTVIDWWMPRSAPTGLQIAAVISIALVLMMVGVALWRSKSDQSVTDPSSVTLIKLLLVFAILYPLFLLVTISTVDFRTPLDPRILLPEFTIGLFINLILLKWFWNWAAQHVALRGAICVFCLMMCSVYVSSSTSWVDAASRAGLGWARTRYVDPALIALLKEIPPDMVLYTNEASPLLADSFKGAIELLPRFNDSPKRDLEYRMILRDVRDTVASGKAMILFFSHKPKAGEMDHATLRTTFALGVRGRGQGWILYRHSARKLLEQRAAKRAAIAATQQADDPDDSDDEPVEVPEDAPAK